MGCFDYTCVCGGETCHHTGGQTNEATVIIEVPLSDGTNVFLKGEYEEYGYVTIELDNKTYNFYLKEFKDCFEGWLSHSSDTDVSYVAFGCWTYEETVEVYNKKKDQYVHKTKKRNCSRDSVPFIPLTSDILSKCISVTSFLEDSEDSDDSDD